MTTVSEKITLLLKTFGEADVNEKIVTDWAAKFSCDKYVTIMVKVACFLCCSINHWF
jgi:hypothetical protein